MVIQFESFKIKSELMNELRQHLLKEAVDSGRTKTNGMIREGIEKIIQDHLDSEMA